MAKKKKFNKHSAVPKREFNAQNDSVRAKKYLGQHFLVDEGIANDIAQTLGFKGYKNVLEIGSGTGVMTKYLLEKDINLTQKIQPLNSIEKQMEALEAVEEMIVNEEISLRDGCYWLEDYTGRSLSPAGLKKIIDNKYGTRQERLGFTA